MATAQYYVINVLELPANQAAAAMFNQSVIVSTGADVGTAREWSHSPFTQSPIGPSVSWPDVPQASRTAVAQAALATEQARLQGRQDTLNRDIAIITATP